MAIRIRTWKTPAGESRETYQIDYVVKGRRIRESFKTKKLAEKRLAVVTVGVDAGTHTPDGQSIDFAFACQQWYAQCEKAGLERVTLVLYQQQIDSHIVPFIGKVLLSRFTAPDVASWEDALTAKGRSAQLIRRVRINLGQIVGEAQRRGQVSQNVVRSTGQAKVSKRQTIQRKLAVGVDIPSVAEIRSLIPHLQGRTRPLVLVAAFAGLRASELRGLTWDNVDLDGRRITVSQRCDRYGDVGAPKSAAGNRTIPVFDLVINALREHKVASAGDLVFANARGNPLARVTADEEFQAAQIAAGIVGEDGGAKYTGLHCLRHFFASYCINRKCDGGRELPLKQVQALCGHSSISVTADVYGHLFPATDDTAELNAAQTAFLAG
jgi:integrase